MKENDDKNKNLLADEKLKKKDKNVDKHMENMTDTLKDLVKSPSSSNFAMTTYIIIIILIFIGLLFLFFFIHFGSFKADILVHDFRMIKPQVDERKYRVIRLGNNLEALLISDQKTSTCAASMSVGVGSFYDDKTINGLAHLFEHMLFLGSKSYPNPNIFNNHLKNYFGSTNAFTEEQKTTYYFDIGKKGFDTALLIFSRIFAEPLLDYHLMNKEIEAVNSEHEKNINQDNWRQQQIIRTLSNPNHPFNMFSTGNKSTFKKINPKLLHKKLNEFYIKYYVPSNMRLTIISNEELETIQDQVTKYFGDIRAETKEENKQTYGSLPDSENAFYKGNLGKLIYFKKLASTLSLDIIFSIDEVLSKYQTKPDDYLTYLLKYSGEGSFISFLKENNYAIKLDAGIINSFTDFSQYAITISLTNEGYKNIEKVIQMTFSYIKKIKELRINRDTYFEIKNINDIKFKFLEKSTKYGPYLSSLAGNMFDYNYKEILFGDFIHKKYNETVIRNFLDSIAPENSLIFIGSNKLPENNFTKKYFNSTTMLKEEWYGTEYMEIKLSENLMENLTVFKDKLPLAIRPENLFITKELNLLTCSKKKLNCFTEKDLIEPSIFYNDTKIRMWAKPDKSFRVPKTDFSINILMKNTKTTPKDLVKIRIFHNYINYILSSKLADAKESGNTIATNFYENGISITSEVYSDLINKIFQIIIENFFITKFDERIFNQTLEFTEKALKQRKKLSPYNKFYYRLQRILKPNSTFYTEELELIKSISYTDFVSSLNIFRSNVLIESLFYGNVKLKSLNLMRDNLVHFANIFRNTSETSLSLKDQDQFHRVFDISDLLVYRINNEFKQEVNHFIANYYQIGVKDIKLSLISTILELSWGNIFYHQLRTKSQLGYIVSGGKTIIDNIMYYRVIVQGSKMSPNLLDIEIEKIIKDIKKKIDKFSPYTLNEYKYRVRNQLSKPDDNMISRFSNCWTEILENTLEFDRKFKLMKELDNISIDDIKNALDSIFFTNPKKLSIQIFSGNSTINETQSSGNYFLNQTKKYKVFNNMNYFRNNNGSLLSIYNKNLMKSRKTKIIRRFK